MTPTRPGSADGPPPGRLRVAIVAANTFEYESRLLKTAQTLADDGHRVTVVAFAGPGLPAAVSLGDRIELRRIELDRRIGEGLRPLPGPVRSAVLRAVGLAPDATALPTAIRTVPTGSAPRSGAVSRSWRRSVGAAPGPGRWRPRRPTRTSSMRRP